MIRLLIPILALCFTASDSFGQIFGGAAPGRFGGRTVQNPIINRVVQPSYPTIPGVPSTRPLVSNGVRLLGNVAIAGVGFLESDVATGVAYGIGPAIRLGRIAVAGSPYPGNRRDTLLWIASPTIIKARDFIRARRGGQPLIGGGGQPIFGGGNFQQPIYPSYGYTQPMIVNNGCCYPGY